MTALLQRMAMSLSLSQRAVRQSPFLRGALTQLVQAPAAASTTTTQQRQCRHIDRDTLKPTVKRYGNAKGSFAKCLQCERT